MSWENNVRRVVPYTPGEQPKINNLIKLNTNENPYPPCPAVMKALGDLDEMKFTLYPDPTVSDLVDALSETYQVPSDQIFVGVGSDDVLGMAFLSFFNSEKKILFPNITYSFYPVWAELFKIPFETMKLQNDFTINPADYYKENGGVVIANPNAPTGILASREAIIDILEHNKDVVVVVDEAYIDFAPEGSSVIDLIDQYENLLVTRTYSKSRSMAGLRIGYAFGSKKLIKYMSDVKYSYNSYTMNYPSIKLGTASLSDPAYFQDCCQKVINTREWFTKELEKLNFYVIPSSTNFVFAESREMSGEELFSKLREEGIIVRHFNQDEIKNFNRITIGTEEDMQKVVAYLKTLFS